MSLELVIIGRSPDGPIVCATTTEPADLAQFALHTAEGDVVPARWPRLDGVQTDGFHIEFPIPRRDPGARVAYRITHNGQTATIAPARHGGASVPAQGTFRVAPGHTDNAAFDFAVGGDQEAFRARFSNLDNSRTTTQIYRDIEQQSPDFFVQLGDVFLREPAWRYVPKLGDLLTSKAPSMSSLRRGLKRDFHEIVRGSLRDMQSFRLLDDHDFRFNGLGAALRDNGNPAGTRKHLERQQVAVDRGSAAFQEFWPMDAPPRSKGLYYAFAWGQCAFIGLQARAFADPHDTSDRRSLLGAEQRAWLEAELRQARTWARFTFILSPLPFAFGKEASEDFRGAGSTWHELLQLFADHGVSGIFTADSHNYSRGHLHVGQTLIPQFLIGTLGGRPQHNPVEFWRGAVRFHTTGQPCEDDLSHPDVRLAPRAYYSARESENRSRFGHALIRVDPSSNAYTVTQYLRHTRGETTPFDQATYHVEDGLCVGHTEANDLRHTLPVNPLEYTTLRDIAIRGVTPTGLAWHPGRDTLLVVGDGGNLVELAVDDDTVLMRRTLVDDSDTPRELQGVAVLADGVVVALDSQGALIELDDALSPVRVHPIPSPFSTEQGTFSRRESMRFEGLCVDADGRIVVTSQGGDAQSRDQHAVLYGIELRHGDGPRVAWRREVADSALSDVERVSGGYWAVSGNVLTELDDTWGEPQQIPIPSHDSVDGITVGPDATAFLALRDPGVVRAIRQQ